MADNYDNQDTLTSQCRRIIVPTLSDTIDFNSVPKALYVTVAGDIRGIAVGDSTPVTFPAVPVGPFDFCRFKRIFVTGTVATLLAGY